LGSSFPIQAQDGADALLHAKVFRQTLAEVGLAGGFEVVVGALAPLANQLFPRRDIAPILQAVEGWVHRCFLQNKLPVAALPQSLRHLIPVHILLG